MLLIENCKMCFCIRAKHIVQVKIKENDVLATTFFWKKSIKLLTILTSYDNAILFFNGNKQVCGLKKVGERNLMFYWSWKCCHKY